jgi:hypothetical protein
VNDAHLYFYLVFFHRSGMKQDEKKVAINLRVDREWRDRVDEWIGQQPIKPSLTQLIISAVDKFIDESDRPPSTRKGREKIAR